MVLKSPETDNKWMIPDKLCLLLQIKYHVSIEINFPIKVINYIHILWDQAEYDVQWREHRYGFNEIDRS